MKLWCGLLEPNWIPSPLMRGAWIETPAIRELFLGILVAPHARGVD